jgi:hypothetical protein
MADQITAVCTINRLPPTSPADSMIARTTQKGPEANAKANRKAMGCSAGLNQTPVVNNSTVINPVGSNAATKSVRQTSVSECVIREYFALASSARNWGGSGRSRASPERRLSRLTLPNADSPLPTQSRTFATGKAASENGLAGRAPDAVVYGFTTWMAIEVFFPAGETILVRVFVNRQRAASRSACRKIRIGV